MKTAIAPPLQQLKTSAVQPMEAQKREYYIPLEKAANKIHQVLSMVAFADSFKMVEDMANMKERHISIIETVQNKYAEIEQVFEFQ